MVKKPVSQNRPRSTTANRRPIAPLIQMSQDGLRGLLRQYQRWRKSCPLEVRLTELLWSLEGMWPEVPTPIIQVPNKQLGRTVAHKVGEEFWWSRKMDRQKEHGDGHLRDREKLQKTVLGLCRAKIYAPLDRMQRKAEASGIWGWEDKISAKKAECERRWQALQIAIVEIGERFRDEYWLDMHSREVCRGIRDEYKVKVDAGAMLPSLTLHHNFVREHLGAVVAPDVQAYLDHLAGVRELWPRIQSHLDYSTVLPADASYRGKDGRPWPPITECRKALRGLSPKLPADTISQLLIAWCLRPFSKTLA